MNRIEVGDIVLVQCSERVDTTTGKWGIVYRPAKIIRCMAGIPRRYKLHPRSLDRCIGGRQLVFQLHSPGEPGAYSDFWQGIVPENAPVYESTDQARRDIALAVKRVAA